MAERGSGLVRYRAERAAALWPSVRSALEKVRSTFAEPQRISFADLASMSGVEVRELGVVLRGDAAQKWLADFGGRIEKGARSSAVVFFEDAPASAAAPAPESQRADDGGDSDDNAGDSSWFPSLL